MDMHHLVAIFLELCSVQTLFFCVVQSASSVHGSIYIHAPCVYRDIFVDQTIQVIMSHTRG